MLCFIAMTSCIFASTEAVSDPNIAQSYSTLPKTTIDDNDYSILYTNVNTINSAVIVTGNTAKYYVKATPASGKSIDYIHITLRLVNDSGTSIDSVSKNVHIGTDGKYKLSDTKILTRHGKYHAKYTLKVYRRGTVVETINGSSKAYSY